MKSEDIIKIFLDNNAYDRLIEMNDEKFAIITQKCKLYRCDTIEDELNAMETKHPDKLERIKAVNEMISIKNIGYWGFCSYIGEKSKNIKGFGRYKSSDNEGIVYTYKTDTYLNNIKEFLDKKGKRKSNHKSNDNDAMIATIANSMGCIVITYDGVGLDNKPKTGNKVLGLYQAIKHNNGKVMTFEELIEMLS